MLTANYLHPQMVTVTGASGVMQQQCHHDNMHKMVLLWQDDGSCTFCHGDTAPPLQLFIISLYISH